MDPKEVTLEQIVAMMTELSLDVKNMKQLQIVNNPSTSKTILVSEPSDDPKSNNPATSENKGTHEDIRAEDSFLSIDEKESLDKWRRLVKKELYGSKTFLLTETNWVTWCRGITIDLTDADMMDYLKDKPMDFPSFYQRRTWEMGDSIVYGYLLGRLSDNIRRDINEAVTAHDMWNRLKTLYANSSTATQNNYQRQWYQLKQGPTQSLHDYIRTIDHLALNMKLAEISVNDSMRIYCLVEGRNDNWAEHKSQIEWAAETYDVTCKKLIALGLAKGEQLKVEDMEEAHFANRMNLQGRRVNIQFCQVCGKKGHGESTCPTGLKLNKDRLGNVIKRCYNCREEGHTWRNCTYQKSGGGTPDLSK